MRSLVVFLALATASTAAAQDPAARSAPSPPLSRDEIASLARLQVAINTAHDSANVQLALPKNTTPQAQLALREKLDVQLADIVHHAGLTEADYRRKAFVVSTDPSTRKVFDSVVVAVSGAPLPGTYVAPAAVVRAVVAVPAGPVGVHIGHVVNAFGDTPGGQGLLSTAVAEAKIAATHAALAMRQPTNLDYMKTHAGHVINAIDPTIITVGPGLKYGLKKAAAGVATHIELAAAAQGASPNVIMHSQHVAMSARNTVTRSDQLLELAQKVQASTTAADAAALVSQMASLADQLVTGVDADADGKIGWQKGEGGLQMCEDHIKLMLAGEK
ncbi:MAG: hypothetical protein JWM95_4531 [Gemmatimonadetes bacterium]|nr:hypothetical protein [Gemmatimonadota bacterium]